jgi:glycosyltransferase involved in cell wall biosynthesis
MAPVLYLSYDGMTDPLGQSQVIPYLSGLAREGYEMHLVSFEKPERFAAGRARIEALLGAAGVHWHPQPYTRTPPVLSTVWDVARLRRVTARLHARHRFQLVHCRSYVAALAGLALHERDGVPFLFDMRGFWPDERVDGGTWRLSHPLYRAVYGYFKRMEARFMAAASGVVVLTEAGRDEIRRWPSFRDSRAPTSVIPCSVDLDHFRIPDEAARLQARRALGLEGHAGPVLVYLGSLGTWYMVDEMVELFAAVRERFPEARLLVVSPDSAAPVVARALSLGIPEDALVTRSATRDEVPGLLAAADVGISFIRPSYSKTASSPTKLGEYMAAGLPVITNAGVGDVARIIERTGAGIALRELTPATYGEAAEALPRLLALERHALRERAAEIYDLRRATAEYARLYRQLVGGARARSRTDKA